MASSSLSQEDVEQDFELCSRRSRIRSARANARAQPAPPNRNYSQDNDGEGSKHPFHSLPHSHGELVDGQDMQYQFGRDTYGQTFSQLDGSSVNAEHDVSPKPTSRAKDKRCPRSNMSNKGKAQRRKLREKRRSTGVVHLPSTESTGGSTAEDEDELLSVEGEKLPSRGFATRNNKSPSDLDADDEDNQDYDSAVNQSDSAVSLFHEGVTIESGPVVPAPRPTTAAVNGRPETPCSDSLEELLERAREENNHLLKMLKERDERINILESLIHKLNCEHPDEKN